MKCTYNTGISGYGINIRFCLPETSSCNFNLRLPKRVWGIQ